MIFIFCIVTMYHRSLLHVESKLTQCRNGKWSHFCSNSLLLEIPTDLSYWEYMYMLVYGKFTFFFPDIWIFAIWAVPAIITFIEISWRTAIVRTQWWYICVVVSTRSGLASFWFYNWHSQNLDPTGNNLKLWPCKVFMIWYIYIYSQNLEREKHKIKWPQNMLHLKTQNFTSANNF